ncbi:MAG TPA: HepT-like ribonuclease domain-containing protein [Candidatus Acidoferrum sp.]|nr:HepT-like ribonuclease domain-containing protein [Candidatus Acidoferrum sp.]
MARSDRHRHRIIHGYDTVDYDIIWRIVTEELPALISALERALPGHVS